MWRGVVTPPSSHAARSAPMLFLSTANLDKSDPKFLILPHALWTLLHTFEELRRAHQGNQQLLELESRVAERAEDAANGVAVAGPLEPAEREPEHLLDDALLARAARGEDAPDLFRLGERRACQSGDLAFRVDRQLDRPDGALPPPTAALGLDH